MEGVIEIMAKRGIDGLGIMFPFQLSFIDANQLLSFPSFFAKAIISDPIKPRGEARLAAKAAEILVGAQERFLREIQPFLASASGAELAQFDQAMADVSAATGAASAAFAKRGRIDSPCGSS